MSPEREDEVHDTAAGETLPAEDMRQPAADELLAEAEPPVREPDPGAGVWLLCGRCGHVEAATDMVAVKTCPECTGDMKPRDPPRKPRGR